MTTFRVCDTDLDDIRMEKYHACLFASGYETRCTNIARIVRPASIALPLVFGFAEESESETRRSSDAFYKTEWGCEPIPMSGDDEQPIYENLRLAIQATEGPIKLLVDYSSMSRIWYAAVLNWARFAVPGRQVTIDFVYSVGRYSDTTHQMVIRNMVTLPGCEGRSYRLRESVAVLGLGFHGLAALCVLDRLESDVVYAFLASPGASIDSAEMTRAKNKGIIECYKTRSVLEIPLNSLESCYRCLAELIAPHRVNGEITLVPMGPKPHVLASILVAMRFQEVACLRVTATSDTSDVFPTGDVIATRVIVCGGS
jgi:hypothetical protein